jgi:hypothetical protein
MSSGEDRLEQFRKDVIRASLLLLLVVSIVLVFVEKSFGLSFLLGSMVSLLDFNLKFKRSKQALERRAVSGVMGSYFVRYLLWGFVLWVSFFSDKLTPGFSVAGLVLCNLVTIGMTLILRKK